MAPLAHAGVGLAGEAIGTVGPALGIADVGL